MGKHSVAEKKKTNVKKIILIIVAIILALVIIAVSTFFILWKTGKTQFHKNDKNITASETDDLQISDDTVTYKGKDYVLNPDVVSVLFIGVDKESIKQDLGYSKNGQADSLFVTAIDTKTKAIKIIPINRETMTAVNIYNDKGEFAETKDMQICLSYAYGNTAKKSCENTRTSVSRYLKGINIGSYVAVDLKGISEITDRIGGVRLNPIEKIVFDDGKVGTPGEEILLNGKEAINYVQNRSEDLNGSINRLARQKQFLEVFASTAGNKLMEDFKRLRTYYNAMSPYISTDMSFSQITYLVSSCLSRNIGNSITYNSIEGEMKMGEKWGEYIPNDDSVLEAIINSFYIEK